MSNLTFPLKRNVTPDKSDEWLVMLASSDDLCVYLARCELSNLSVRVGFFFILAFSDKASI